MQAHELSFRPRILFGIGEEGGEPIHGQAHSHQEGVAFPGTRHYFALYLIFGFLLEIPREIKNTAHLALIRTLRKARVDTGLGPDGDPQGH